MATTNTYKIMDFSTIKGKQFYGYGCVIHDSLDKGKCEQRTRWHALDVFLFTNKKYLIDNYGDALLTEDKENYQAFLGWYKKLVEMDPAFVEYVNNEYYGAHLSTIPKDEILWSNRGLWYWVLSKLRVSCEIVQAVVSFRRGGKASEDRVRHKIG